MRYSPIILPSSSCIASPSLHALCLFLLQTRYAKPFRVRSPRIRVWKAVLRISVDQVAGSFKPPVTLSIYLKDWDCNDIRVMICQSTQSGAEGLCPLTHSPPHHTMGPIPSVAFWSEKRNKQ